MTKNISKHFASVATDPNYNKDNIITELTRYISSSVNTAETEASYSPVFIATVLSRVRKTSTGSDGIPYWVFKECAGELCVIISVLMNFSMYAYVCVPRVWKHAIITPARKVQPVTNVSDLRPISVTPVFS